MTITIITACYNSAVVIRTAMASVLRQTWPEIEYVVVDGGSTDGTVEVIRAFEPKFCGRMRWVSEKDCGLYDAINKGIRMATGEVVGILNADDVLADDDVIARIAEAFEGRAEVRKCGSAEEEECGNDGIRGDNKAIRHSCNKAMISSGDLAAVYGDIRFVANCKDADLEVLRREKTVRYYSSKCWRPWLARFGYMPAHPSFYCRREVFNRLGGYQTDYKIAADHELLIRYLVKERVRYRYIPGAFVMMRLGGISTRSIKSTLVLNGENIRACRSNGIYTNWVMQLGKYAFKVAGLACRKGF